MKKNRYSDRDILAFIDSARRLPATPQKEIYVRWLVKQYELCCTATVVKANKSPHLTNDNKYCEGEKHGA
jgi:hypothetical protein